MLVAFPEDDGDVLHEAVQGPVPAAARAASQRHDLLQAGILHRYINARVGVAVTLGLTSPVNVKQC